MRKLNFGDTFKAARLIKELNLKEELKEIASNQEQDQYEAGVDLLYTVLEKGTTKECEQKIYEFLSGPLEMQPEEVSKLEFFEVVDKIFKIADIESWKGFIQSVAKLMK